MKSLLLKYKDVFKFLLVFVATYSILSVFYWLYLDQSAQGIAPDAITSLVARQSEAVIETMGYDAKVTAHPLQPSLQLFINNTFLARIVEGCNAISIIILFISFIVAFTQELKTTALYIFAGSVLIYAINIVRIAVLAIALYKFPEQQEFLHSVLFPLIIYGIVVTLWFIWVRMISQKAIVE